MEYITYTGDEGSQCVGLGTVREIGRTGVSNEPGEEGAEEGLLW